MQLQRPTDIETQLAALDEWSRSVLEYIAPSEEELPQLLAMMAAVPPPHTADYPGLMTMNVAMLAVWQELTPETAETYAQSLLPPLRQARRVHSWVPPTAIQVGPIELRWFGLYQARAVLGMGGSGKAFAAVHIETGQQVAIKVHADAEWLAFEWFGGELPPQFLRIYESGVLEEVYGPLDWVAREFADETWGDYMARTNRGVPVSLDIALPVFVTACEGVAALHDAHVYQWSAHDRNLFRVGSVWKLGDLGRCVFAAWRDDPRWLRCAKLEGLPPALRCSLLDTFDGGPWSRGQTGIMQRDPMREQRLRLDDCAMLGGLLCDLLGLNRWRVFHKAIKSRPLCVGRYGLTGRAELDARLSKILNRAWLGDSGGALAVANGQEWTTGYDDARDLLADVMAAVA